MFKYEYVLPIGDWSNDGHGRCEEIRIATNKNKKEIIEAYRKTCKKLNVTFDTNELYESYPIRLLVDGNDLEISNETMNILFNNGLNENCMKKFFSEYGDCYFFGSSEDAVKFFMEFVKISLLDLNYEIVNEQKDYLFGYWGDLNIMVGYGVLQ